jgi:hypothetical protein
MIPLNELRIGNRILANNVAGTVKAINKDGISISDPELSGVTTSLLNNDFDKVQPIPLTDQLLLQYGFAFNNHTRCWQKRRLSNNTFNTMELDMDYNAVDFMRRPIVKKIKYLHKLQNLYFELKGEELLEQLSPVKE